MFLFSFLLSFFSFETQQLLPDMIYHFFTNFYIYPFYIISALAAPTLIFLGAYYFNGLPSTIVISACLVGYLCYYGYVFYQFQQRGQSAEVTPEVIPLESMDSHYSLPSASELGMARGNINDGVNGETTGESNDLANRLASSGGSVEAGAIV